MIQHGSVAEEIRSWKTLATGEEPRMYRMAFLAKGGPRICPLEACQGQVVTRTAMQVHFIHRHIMDTVVILEEGNPVPTTVTPMQHSGPLAYTERKASVNRTVCQGGRSKRGGG